MHLGAVEEEDDDGRRCEEVVDGGMRHALGDVHDDIAVRLGLPSDRLLDRYHWDNAAYCRSLAD